MALGHLVIGIWQCISKPLPHFHLLAERKQFPSEVKIAKGAAIVLN